MFFLVFVSRDSELDQNLSGDFREKISFDLNEIWYVLSLIINLHVH